MSTDRYPGATWRPVSYAAEAGPFSSHPLGWILHVTCMTGSPWGVFEHAPAGARKFSHLWVARDGRVEQYGSLTDKSWAQADGNGRYWSVETEGQPTEPLTDAQLDALAAWHSWCGAPDLLAQAPGQPGIGTHFMGGAAWGGHTCPDPSPGAGPRSHQRDEILRRSNGGTDMPLSQADAILVADMVENRYGVKRADGKVLNRDVALGMVLDAVSKLSQPSPVDVDALAAALAKRIPAGTGIDPKTLAAAVADELSARFASR